MRTLAYASIILAATLFIMGSIEKLGVSLLVTISPVGYVKAATIFLLFGLNFEFIELLSKKSK